MLKPEVKQQWVEALRSGEYKQGRVSLRAVTELQDLWCALGVLCDKCNGEWIKIEDCYAYKDKGEEGFSIPPDSVLQYSGLDLFISELGKRKGKSFANAVHQVCEYRNPDYIFEKLQVFEGFMVMNDKGATFEEIADVIEKYL